MSSMLLVVVAVVALVIAAPAAVRRWRLSRAKARTWAGHPRLARAAARLVRSYAFEDAAFFASDGATSDVVACRRAGFSVLEQRLAERTAESRRLTHELAHGLSDLQFTGRYRVPFPYGSYVRRHLEPVAVACATDGVLVRDADGNEAYDLSGSYGLNVFGSTFYKGCIEAGVAAARDLGPQLGVYHPMVLDNVRRLRQVSGADEVSFHMSGTEAVMQAVRLARYHTGRSHLVRFAGAYHGWWDGVQPGLGNPRPGRDVYTLRELDERTLHVLRTRRDIACVLVNPLQMLHPNLSPPNDGTLIDGGAPARCERSAYADWLRQLRRVCSSRGIALIFDEVFVGFRLALGGAQEYFGVDADLVTYGKTVAGGLPVGVLCGRAALMRRFRPDRPSDVCLARGTFSAHPYVMGTMHAFLERVMEPAVRDSYRDLDARWDHRIGLLNERLARRGVPVRLTNLASIASVGYTAPARYHWLLQYYLRAEGIALSWVGTGRLIFSHDYTDETFAVVVDRFDRAASAMQADGWWSGPAVTAADIRRQVLREMIAAAASPARSTLTPLPA